MSEKKEQQHARRPSCKLSSMLVFIVFMVSKQQKGIQKYASNLASDLSVVLHLALVCARMLKCYRDWWFC